DAIKCAGEFLAGDTVGLPGLHDFSCCVSGRMGTLRVDYTERRGGSLLRLWRQEPMCTPWSREVPYRSLAAGWGLSPPLRETTGRGQCLVTVLRSADALARALERCTERATCAGGQCAGPPARPPGASSRWQSGRLRVWQTIRHSGPCPGVGRYSCGQAPVPSPDDTQSP